MKLSPREKDKLLVSLAAIVARNRKSRGVKLNYPEAIALITDFVIEGARDGKSVAELMEAGAHVIKKDDCMSGIPDIKDYLHPCHYRRILPTCIRQLFAEEDPSCLVSQIILISLVEVLHWVNIEPYTYNHISALILCLVKTFHAR